MRAATVAEMALAPVARYAAGASWAHFCAAPTLWGVVLWGAPDGSACRELVTSLRLELGPPAEPHVSVIDARRVERPDPEAFTELERYVRAETVALGRQVRRLALLRPAGLPGAVIAGAYEVMGRPYPVEIFSEPREAGRWLARETHVPPAGAELARLGELCDAVHADASATAPVLRALQCWLDTRLGEPLDVGAAARALALGERTLQRRLGEHGTSLTQELGRARIRSAQRLLATSDAPLAEVARAVGCGSLPHFSALFRRHTGLAPGAWRTRYGR
ncbi:MAG: helix-turn-helix transcriptional regulator [Polyangiaceae bacterium]|nr:helix-turn-helix transcriptional regulator [Polyangiaceae bacterium]